MGLYFSFHHDTDAMRAQRVQRLSGLHGQPLLDGPRWADVAEQGDDEAKAWIATHMRFTGTVVVLIGEHTASCPWVRHEILTAWEDCRPMIGIHVHGLADAEGHVSERGESPFYSLKFRSGGHMSDYVPVFEPVGEDDAAVRADIAANLADWLSRGARRIEPKAGRGSSIALRRH